MLSDRFRAAVEGANVDQALVLFREDAAFRSPVVFKPYEGRDRVMKVLRAAERVLGIGVSFRYVHQLEDPDDRVAILEFATEVDGRQVEGIDKLTFDLPPDKERPDVPQVQTDPRVGAAAQRGRATVWAA